MAVRSGGSMKKQIKRLVAAGLMTVLMVSELSALSSRQLWLHPQEKSIPRR